MVISTVSERFPFCAILITFCSEEGSIGSCDGLEEAVRKDPLKRGDVDAFDEVLVWMANE